MHSIQIAEQFPKITIQILKWPQFNLCQMAIIEQKEHACISVACHLLWLNSFTTVNLNTVYISVYRQKHSQCNGKNNTTSQDRQKHWIFYHNIYYPYAVLRSKSTFCYNFISCPYIYIYIFIFGGAHGVMVIVVGNGHGDTSSNPGRDWLHFTLH